MTQNSSDQPQGRWRDDGSYDWGDGTATSPTGEVFRTDGQTPWGTGADATGAPTDPWQRARYENDVFAQQRGGGGLLPFPHKSWRTSRGTQVTVGGCCLPLPIGCLATTMVAAATVGKAVLDARRR